MATVLFVIAPQTFRDEEYAHPKEVLESRGAHTVTASAAAGTCTGKLGMKAVADLGLVDVSPTDYDAIVFVGGAGSQVFFDDREAHRIAREGVESGIVVAAICIAPSILAHAGLLHGRRVTSFPSQETDLVDHGAAYVEEPVVVDSLLITANGPDAAAEFGHAIARALGLPPAPLPK